MLSLPEYELRAVSYCVCSPLFLSQIDPHDDVRQGVIVAVGDLVRAAGDADDEIHLGAEEDAVVPLAKGAGAVPTRRAP